MDSSSGARLVLDSHGSFFFSHLSLYFLSLVFITLVASRFLLWLAKVTKCTGWRKARGVWGPHGNAEHICKSTYRIYHKHYLTSSLCFLGGWEGAKVCLPRGLSLLIKRNEFLPTAAWMTAKLSCCLISTT